MVSFLDKQRKRRTCLNFKQVNTLTQSFLKNVFPTRAEIIKMAKQLRMTAQQVRVWFQNQRQKARIIENNFINSLINRFKKRPEMSKLEILAEISVIEYEIRNKSS